MSPSGTIFNPYSLLQFFSEVSLTSALEYEHPNLTEDSYSNLISGKHKDRVDFLPSLGHTEAFPHVLSH